MVNYLNIHQLMRQKSTGQLNRREFMKRAFALGLTAPAVASMLSACATVEPGATTTAPAGSDAAPVAQTGSESAQRFDKLIVALNSDLASLDLMWGTPNINRDVMGHVYEYLFTMGEGNIYIPDLAEGMDVSEDGTVFTIQLRQGVNFHNGKVMTSEDVLASMLRWQRMTQRGSSLLAASESITALDDHTIEIVFSEPNGGFLYGIGHYGGLFGVLPSEIVEKYYDESVEENPDSQITEIADAIGTGPYKVTEWVLDRSVVMERFEDYSARDEPIDGRGGRRHAYAGVIEFIPVPDATTRLNGLIAGEYHIAYDLSPAQYEQVVSDQNLIPFVIKPGSKAVGVFNKQKGPFADQKLRQAALAATDAFEVMAGTVDNPEFYGAFASLAGPEWAFWYTEEGKELYETRDLEKARQLIAETDYDGEPLRWITTRDFDYMYRSALIATQQWAEAGLNVELVVSDWPTVVTNRSDPDAYEIFSTGIGFAGDPLGTSAYTSNWPGWTTSPGVTGAYASLITETDQDKRKELWVDLQRAFYEEVPYIQFGERYAFRAVRAEVQGFTDRPDFMVWNVWLAS
ncbi:hypothetical protein GC175_05145 [bacterium]|nr:hypothetical protein [bacterium]